MKSTLQQVLIVVSLIAAIAADGVVHADRPPPPRRDTSVAKDADGAGAPSVRRLGDPRPRRLPDGVFLGRFELDAAPVEGEPPPRALLALEQSSMRVTIVGGRVTEASLKRPGSLEGFDLYPVESGDSIAIRLQGSSGEEYIRINGAFFDQERGAGRFDGVLGRRKTSGTWILARR